MSLSLSLNNALSGLKANQQSISVLSHNIANANTEGYSRQLVDQSALYIDGIGSGVRVDDIVRKVDKYLQRAVQTQGSTLSSANVVNEYYQRINVLLGQPGSDNTLDEYVSGFFNSLQAMVETPDRSSARSDVTAAATRLSTNISNMAYDLNDLRFEADREMATTVDSINAVMDKLNKLNTAITTTGALGKPVAGLLDQRDLALNELSSYIDISTSYNSYGAVNVITTGGVALVDGMPKKMVYLPSQSADQFAQESQLNGVVLYDLDSNGNTMGNGTALISAGTSANVTSTLTGGKLEGLRMMRDDVIPAMLDQYDMLAANVRDAVNAVHNDGSGFPPANSLTGTRPIVASDAYNWQGSVRIAVLQKDGQPVPAAFSDESYTGWRALTLDLSALNDGSGAGHPSMQAIIDEINNHFQTPASKVEVGNLNNIRLVSGTDSLPLGASGTLFNFDFEVENISAYNADFFIGGITVRDASGTDITNVTVPPASLALDPADTYYTTAGIPDVTVNTLTTPNVQVGDTIYLGPPGTANVNGIPASDITGFFTVVAVGGNSVTFQARSNAGTTGTVADASGVYIQNDASDQVIEAGNTERSSSVTGKMQVDLGGAPNSAYYDITVSVATRDENGVLQTSNLTYRVTNGTKSLLNDRYDATSATGDGTRILPNTTQEPLKAILVDENGKEVKKENGEYIDYYPSYLKIYSPNGNYGVAIDEMDSAQKGNVQNDPPDAGTSWGFSHYFGLNDFFEANQPTKTGDTLKNSALNMQVSQRLLDNPNLISSGDLVLQQQPSDPIAQPQYTYVRYAGDNQLAARLLAVGTQALTFDPAGGLPSSKLTIAGYTSEMLGNIASKSSAATAAADNAQTLYDGFKTRAEAISGVNLDEELANTVIFQNSYAATARIITVVNQMFEDIMQML